MSSRANILVTGGAGFIGSHACKALVAAGYLPVTLDNFSTGHRDAVKWGPCIGGDIRDTALVREALTSHRIDAVMHFAAKAYVGESMHDPAIYYDNNVSGTASVLAACRQAGVGDFIFSSSCATYGEPSALPITEATTQRPVNPYGRTKLIGEQMIADHAAAYGLRHVTLRYFNAAGADPAGELAERHEPETHLIPLALIAAHGKREALAVFGSDYATPDGTCIRDFVHVGDLAQAHAGALSYLLGGGSNVALNIGSGRGYSILDIVAEVERVTGRAIRLRFEPRRAGDPPVLIADPRLAERVLGFVTKLSDIGTIVADASAHFKIGAGNAIRA
ncbi:MAG: UDP-glucose 4-epimerase GalE [Pararhodobacter sp.]|nr:UDP-glucose 4-epimerase GalE [Pararhodobacter sp.]